MKFDVALKRLDNEAVAKDCVQKLFLLFSRQVLVFTSGRCTCRVNLSAVFRSWQINMEQTLEAVVSGYC